MRKVSLLELRRTLPRLLEQVERGESFVVTRRGNPVAVLVPNPKPSAKGIRAVVQEMLEYRQRQNCTLGRLTIRELIDEGRRY